MPHRRCTWRAIAADKRTDATREHRKGRFIAVDPHGLARSRKTTPQPWLDGCVEGGGCLKRVNDPVLPMSRLVSLRAGGIGIHPLARFAANLRRCDHANFSAALPCHRVPWFGSLIALPQRATTIKEMSMNRLLAVVLGVSALPAKVRGLPDRQLRQHRSDSRRDRRVRCSGEQRRAACA